MPFILRSSNWLLVSSGGPIILLLIILATRESKLSPTKPINANSTADHSPSQAAQENYNSSQTEAIRLNLNDTATSKHDAEQARNCSLVCSTEEFSSILQRLSNHEEKTIARFKEISASDQTSSSHRSAPQADVDELCMVELVELIRDLASNELEMKQIMDIASDDTRQTNPQARLSNLTNSTVNDPRGGIKIGKRLFNKSCQSNTTTTNTQDELSVDAILHLASKTAPTSDDSYRESSLDKTRAATKAIASVDHWIRSLERFVATNEWSSARKVLKGIESILENFVSSSQQNSVAAAASLKVKSSLTVSNGSIILPPTIDNNSAQIDQTVERLKATLPEQVQTLTTSLNSLFPWHVWPWNNVDLYATIDTFLNHGLFAFSKTTSQPERRIDYLGAMLETLFKSLKLDSFPKKCLDWSRVICDQKAFNQWLAPIVNDDSHPATSLKQRNRSTELMQELACIMFSSLSMQRFGSSDELEKSFVSELSKLMTPQGAIASASASADLPMTGELTASPTSPMNPISLRLSWDKQIIKALSLYTSSRMALNEQQWLSLYKLIQDLWAQQKISDRVMMTSRVIQLLTNCHMPREMLESALWKDIYKYKNVLKQIIDIVIEELNKSSESGQFTIEQLALGSRHLNEILTKFIQILPKLIEALTQTFVDDLPDLVNRFFKERQVFFKVPCKGQSFSDIIQAFGKHRSEIIQLEELICQQFDIKPNITMMKVNNFTNEFLAMAFNFTSFSNALGLPKLVSQLDSSIAVEKENVKLDSSQVDGASNSGISRANVTSILDELAANERLESIVAILQSSALDPPEVHAELPELDWVEAGTSVAMMYESIQRLISFEGAFSVFPEVEKFQSDIRASVEKSQTVFKGFTKRDPIRLMAYALDGVFPIFMRTYKPMDSFHSECSAAFRDLVGEDNEGRATRQYQCLISSLNYASWAANRLMNTFNEMFANVLAHMPNDSSNLSRVGKISSSVNNATTTGECIFLDGSVNYLTMNLAQLADLAVETLLTVSTSTELQRSYKDLLCNHTYQLDPFVDRGSLELKNKTRVKFCSMLSRDSFSACENLLKFEEWKTVLAELNRTWFESGATSVEPSFRRITLQAHKFLQLFGQFKPQTFSDGLMSKVFSGKPFWSEYSSKISLLAQGMLKRRFELSLQVLSPIIYDNLPQDSKSLLQIQRTKSGQSEGSRVREMLIATIMIMQAAKDQLTNRDTNVNITMHHDENQAQIGQLISWLDENSLQVAEIMLITLAQNVTKLESLFTDPGSRISARKMWVKFCGAPVNTYLEFGSESVTAQNHSSIMSKAKDLLCNFDWALFYKKLNASGAILDGYSEQQLVRIALTKSGQSLDALFSDARPSKHVLKFSQLEYWQALQGKIVVLSPSKDEPSSLMWIWSGLERIVRAFDGNSSQVLNSLTRMSEQLNCGLEAIKGGLSWENLANIFQDKHDVLAAHATINNIFELVSIGYGTFADNAKFHQLLEKLVKPKLGLRAFCDMRNSFQLASVFAMEGRQDSEAAIENLQELVCDTNFELILQNINPISMCYQTANFNISLENQALAESIDRLSKLVSLAIIDAKLMSTTASKPVVFDPDQWSEMWNDHLKRVEPSRRVDVSLAVVRVFQAIDSVNSHHFLWRVLFKSVHEISEALAYALRAMNDSKDSSSDIIGVRSRLLSVKKAAQEIDFAIRSNRISEDPQKVISSLTKLVPSKSQNYLSYKTFKQLRYIKSISEYFTVTPGAQDSTCLNTTIIKLTEKLRRQSRIELIGYKLDNPDKLRALLCHYHPSQWLTVLNIITSTETSSIPKKVNLMAKQLSIFARGQRNNDTMKSFIHKKQLRSIEVSANTTVSYIMVTVSHSNNFSINKISNLTWHTIPDLLDDMNSYVCPLTTGDIVKADQTSKNRMVKLELEVLMCKMPQWNLTQSYNYISEKLDLQNLISSMVPEQASENNSLSVRSDAIVKVQERSCSSIFKFASRWLRIVQGLSAELYSRSTREKIRKCLKSQRKAETIQSLSLRFVRVVNNILTSVSNMIGSDSWLAISKTWSSISRAILEDGPTNLPVQLY